MSTATEAVREVRARIDKLDDPALDLIFREARTHNGWQARPLPEALLRDLHDLMIFGPTSANCQPARILFLQSAAAKEKLRPALLPGNLEKTLAAPVTAVVGYDASFFEDLPRLFPHKDMSGMFRDNAALAEATAFRNGTLQGAYFIVAARALGLDCGPMSGFDQAAVDAAFFAGTTVKSNFLCNLGYGDEAQVFDRSPRYGFDEVCKIL
ncbi:MAG: malonic semialdehyde reductase [Rhodospirillales bacterium]